MELRIIFEEETNSMAYIKTVSGCVVRHGSGWAWAFSFIPLHQKHNSNNIIAPKNIQRAALTF
jgi:hypothetical protein